MPKQETVSLRKHLDNALRMKGAHLTFDEVLADFSRNPKYEERKFPDDYWPATDSPPSDEAWKKSVKQFQKDLKEMQALIADTHHDLLARIPHGQGQTLLREALLVADHNSYHLGQIVFLRKMLEP